MAAATWSVALAATLVGALLVALVAEVRDLKTQIRVNKALPSEQEQERELQMRALEVRVQDLEQKLKAQVSEPTKAKASIGEVQLPVKPKLQFLTDRRQAKIENPVAKEQAKVANSTASSVPVGAVVDWWRMDKNLAIPSGYELCDGSRVLDLHSLIFGKLKPNLTSFFTKAEIKIFSNDSCPEGWTEVNNLKGYLLTGRPSGGKTMATINSPMQPGESYRVAPHSHNTTLADNGHGHSINDPGHTHGSDAVGPYERGHNNKWGGVFGNHDNQGGIDIQKSTTGISFSSSKTGISVSVNANSGAGYPLAYVLLCERTATSADVGLIKILRVV